MLKIKLIPTFVLSLAISSAWAANLSWPKWLHDFKQEALSNGIKASVFEEAFKNIHEPNRTVKGLLKNQPEHRISYPKYINSRADKNRVAIGVMRLKQNLDILKKISNDYNVNPCYIVSFWGMETSYGSYMGNFNVIQSLATLAYDSHRQDFFRNQLLIALHIVQDGHVTLKDFKGEWAGATGQPQFLPSSWVEYAVDYDHDGKKDIWKSKTDVFASIANYMKKNGWHNNQPTKIEVILPKNFDKNLINKTISKPIKEWIKLGVKSTNNQPIPHPELSGSIINPQDGPVFLIYPNYHMILKYNNSVYYAGAISYMADKICQSQNLSYDN